MNKPGKFISLTIGKFRASKYIPNAAQLVRSNSGARRAKFRAQNCCVPLCVATVIAQCSRACLIHFHIFSLFAHTIHKIFKFHRGREDFSVRKSRRKSRRAGEISKNGERMHMSGIDLRAEWRSIAVLSILAHC